MFLVEHLDAIARSARFKCLVSSSKGFWDRVPHRDRDITSIALVRCSKPVSLRGPSRSQRQTHCRNSKALPKSFSTGFLLDNFAWRYSGQSTHRIQFCLVSRKDWYCDRFIGWSVSSQYLSQLHRQRDSRTLRISIIYFGMAAVRYMTYEGRKQIGKSCNLKFQHPYYDEKMTKYNKGRYHRILVLIPTY